ncbi:ATP-dependent DNA helicase RRM3-like [Telopea speciosissima]|uniref:ATP-dependent DNA helicase RRM3-like n=1 Tax=Telopea speciosissima TaxID=54955 RepID=UPI001CC6D469|nr:ATP-dependent DNA helicase RRM3-like [Telopea speciosissima]
MILVYCEPADVMKLWNDILEAMSEDIRRTDGTAECQLLQTITDINSFLQSMGRSINDYELPKIEKNPKHSKDYQLREIADEYVIELPLEEYNAPNKLNLDKKHAYNIILEYVEFKKSGIFFIDGPGGTEKTYLYHALLATLRSKNEIALATATSEVAAAIMAGGRTIYSRFKISININDSSICSFSKQCVTAELIRRAKLIIWNEAPMAKREAIEAIDRTLQDVIRNSDSFGGKVIVFGGDFKQVLPVVPRAKN